MGAVECCLARTDDKSLEFEIHPLIEDEDMTSVCSIRTINKRSEINHKVKRYTAPMDPHGVRGKPKKAKTLKEINNMQEHEARIESQPYTQEEDIRSRRIWFALFAAAVIIRYHVWGGIIASLLIIFQVLYNAKLRPVKRRSVAMGGRISIESDPTTADTEDTGLRKGSIQPESEPSEESRSSSSVDEGYGTITQDNDAYSEDDDAFQASKNCYEGLPFTYAEVLAKVASLRQEIGKMGLKPVYKFDFGPDGTFSDTCLLRFIVACEGEVMKSAKMLKTYTAWRIDKYHHSVPASEWIGEMSGDQAGLLTFDFATNTGQPIVVLRGRYRKKGRPVEITRNFCVGVIDGASAVAHKLKLKKKYTDKKTGKPLNPLEKYSCILDLGGFGYGNADLDGLLEVAKILFRYFPECLGNVWIIHSNFIFAAMWAVVKVFLPKRNLSKYVFFKSEEEYKAFFPTIIDPLSLPERYGGLADDHPKEYVGRYRPEGCPEYVTGNGQ